MLPLSTSSPLGIIAKHDRITAAATALYRAVSVVVELSAEKQVLRSHASGVIAAMANAQAGRPLIERHQPGDAMRKVFVLVEVESTVPAFVQPPAPLPAFTGAIDLRPKAGFVGRGILRPHRS